MSYEDDEGFYEPPDPPRIGFRDLTWTTKDGKEILICHLEDEHLINIINLLKKKGEVVPYMMEMELAHRRLEI